MDQGWLFLLLGAPAPGTAQLEPVGWVLVRAREVLPSINKAPLFPRRDVGVLSTNPKGSFISLASPELQEGNKFRFSAGRGDMVALEFHFGPVMRGWGRTTESQMGLSGKGP